MSDQLPCFSQNNNNLSAYELQRLENIKEIRKVLGGAFFKVQESASNLANSSKNKPEQMFSKDSGGNLQSWSKKKILRKQSPKQVEFVRRSLRIRHKKRTSTNELSEDDNNDDEEDEKETFHQESFVIKLPCPKNKKDVEQDDKGENFTGLRKSKNKRVDISKNEKLNDTELDSINSESDVYLKI